MSGQQREAPEEAFEQLLDDMTQMGRDMYQDGYRDGLTCLRNAITEVLGPDDMSKHMSVSQVLGLIDGALIAPLSNSLEGSS